MGNAETTREKLLAAAREAMWRRGYPEVGPALRAGFEAGFLGRFRASLTGPEAAARAALFTGVLLGLVLARKSLALPGMADAEPDEILRQNRYALTAMLSYPGDGQG